MVTKQQKGYVKKDESNFRPTLLLDVQFSVKTTVFLPINTRGYLFSMDLQNKALFNKTLIEKALLSQPASRVGSNRANMVFSRNGLTFAEPAVFRVAVFSFEV